ncbi:fibronectin type III domain-containing protein, partial [bacterium]|nr:fibronectin type III domain-containing protein [candidate division CSSED10-310 bacterium]
MSDESARRVSMSSHRASAGILSVVALLTGLAILCGACGKKAPLIIPKPRIPEAVVDLKAAVGCEYVILSWNPPTRNQNGTPLTDLKEFVIYRRRGAMTSVEEAQATAMKAMTAKSMRSPTAVPEAGIIVTQTPTPLPDTGFPPEIEFKEIARVTLQEVESQIKDREFEEFGALRLAFADRYEDEEPEVQKPRPKPDETTVEVPDGFLQGYRYYYKVVAENTRRRPGLESPIVKVDYALQPGAPLDVTAQSRERSVVLTWREPSVACSGGPAVTVKGYNVYRSEDEDLTQVIALNPLPLEETTHTDSSVQDDKDYYYYVRAIGAEYPVPGPRSRQVMVNTTDVFPPAV